MRRSRPSGRSKPTTAPMSSSGTSFQSRSDSAGRTSPIGASAASPRVMLSLIGLIAAARVASKRKGCVFPFDEIFDPPHWGRSKSGDRFGEIRPLRIPLSCSLGHAENSGKLSKACEPVFHIGTVTSRTSRSRLSPSWTSHAGGRATCLEGLPAREPKDLPALTDEVFTVSEVAAILKVSEQTVRKWI